MLHFFIAFDTFYDSLNTYLQLIILDIPSVNGLLSSIVNGEDWSPAAAQKKTKKNLKKKNFNTSMCSSIFMHSEKKPHKKE